MFEGTDHVRTMLSMTTELEVGMSSAKARSRKWSAIKTVFREEKILKFRGFLQETKSTLILARQTLSEFVYNLPRVDWSN